MINRIVAALAAVLVVAGLCLAADKKISDDLISDQVRLRLASDPDVKGGALEANSKDGVVTLGGVVESQHQKDKASKLAKKVKGVKSVVNNITLKERSAGR